MISRHARLYTEMVTTGAILHGERKRFLDFDPAEHPLALQLGGCDPLALAQSARIAEDWGYDEVNLNLGCPSDRVQNGRFGACLMAEPQRVADCVAAMAAATRLPVTVKTRIGIDERDSYEQLTAFVAALAGAGCRTLIVHARKAWLKGLSPRENREIPPLRYDVVYRLKRDFPALTVVINGGITDLAQVEDHLIRVDGTMLGRAAYQNPYLLAEADSRLFDDPTPPPSRHQVVERLLPYVEAQRAQGVHLSAISRHILGLFQGLPGARAWRRHISENAHRPGAGPEVIRQALARVPRPEADQPGLSKRAAAGL
ncbi:MAG: tRNA dihydrouridine(20/20a) synthase DusA [Candidatus Competibacteraceae bacterium]|nr:tRNA dihydrouridine(20/20a) synthase DusA [Candidatus Competibacteraceae bacterium]